MQVISLDLFGIKAVESSAGVEGFFLTLEIIKGILSGR
jgi:hypothetical protein